MLKKIFYRLVIFTFFIIPAAGFCSSEADQQTDMTTIETQAEKASSAKKEIIITDENAFELLFGKETEVARKAEIYILTNTPEVLLPALFQRIKIEKEELVFENLLEIAYKYPFEKSRKYWDDLMITDGPADFQIKVIRKYSTFESRDIIYLLSEKIESPHFSVREAACVELEKIRNDRTFSKVFAMALSENPVKRLYASQALFYLYDSRFVSVIGDMMKDKNKSVRLYTLRIIRKFTIENSYGFVKEAAQNDENSEVMAEAMRTMIATKNNTAMYVFTKNLADESIEVRQAAAEGILFFSYTNGIYAVAKQLEMETDDEVKNILIDIHLKIKNGGGFKGLQKIIESEPNSYLRIKTAYILGVIGGQSAESLLMLACADADFRVRAEAAAALSDFKSKDTVNCLIELVRNDNNLYVRTAAVYSLQSMKNKNILPDLNDMLLKEKNIIMKKILNTCIQKLN